MVATFLAWLIPLLAMLAGGFAWFLAVLAGEVDYSRGPTVALTRRAGIAVFLIGLVLTGINIWELF
ncbi:MAG: hypothetical protein ABIF45_17480 [Pseudomonadota bacterium]